MSVKSKKCGGGPRSPRRDRDATPRQIALSSSLFPSLLMFLFSLSLSVSSVGIPLPRLRSTNMYFLEWAWCVRKTFILMLKALHSLTWAFMVEKWEEGSQGSQGLCFLIFNFYSSVFRGSDLFLRERSSYLIEWDLEWVQIVLDIEWINWMTWHLMWVSFYSVVKKKVSWNVYSSCKDASFELSVWLHIDSWTG